MFLRIQEAIINTDLIEYCKYEKTNLDGFRLVIKYINNDETQEFYFRDEAIINKIYNGLQSLNSVNCKN